MTSTQGDNRLPELADTIRGNVSRARAHSLAAAEAAMQAGAALIEAKALLPHGEWTPWLKANFAMSPRSARRLMQVAASGLKTDTVAVMGLRGASEALAERGRRRSIAHLYGATGALLSALAADDCAELDAAIARIPDPADRVKAWQMVIEAMQERDGLGLGGVLLRLPEAVGAILAMGGGDAGE